MKYITVKLSNLMRTRNSFRLISIRFDKSIRFNRFNAKEALNSSFKLKFEKKYKKKLNIRNSVDRNSPSLSVRFDSIRFGSIRFRFGTH